MDPCHRAASKPRGSCTSFPLSILKVPGLHFPGLPTRKSSLGSKATLRTGASWPRSVFCWLLSDTSTTFTMKSLRRAEELRINMCKQACVGNLCSHVTDKGNISSEPTRVQIVKSMKRRSKNNPDFLQHPPECRCHIRPNSLRRLISFLFFLQSISQQKLPG